MLSILLLLLAGSVHAAVVPLSNPNASVLSGVVSCAGGAVNIDSGTQYIDCTNNRLGVGTTSPGDTAAGADTNYNAHIFSAATTRLGIEGTNVSVDLIDSNASANDRIWRVANVGGLWGLYQLSDTTTVDSNPFNVEAGGDVGIGTTNPATVLHAVGTTGVRKSSSTTSSFHSTNLGAYESPPGSCSIGDEYTDASGAKCFCDSANNWIELGTGAGDCT